MEQDADRAGHRKRLRERYEKTGIHSFQDYEILELLLTYSVPRKDVKPIAKELMKRYKKVEDVLKADIRELEKIKGLGKNSGILLNVIGDLVKIFFQRDHRELSKSNNPRDLTSIGGKSDLINYLRSDIGFSGREEFKVLYLDSANHLIGDVVLFQGTLDRSTIYPREIIREAFLHEARSIIFAHNHPSGNLQPSKKDIELTNSMKIVFEEVGLRLLEHIIITRDSYFSFLEEGLLDY